jgi:hypothetical protein
MIRLSANASTSLNALAHASARPLTRRGMVGLLAGCAAAIPAIVRASEDPGGECSGACGPDELCLGGICSVVVVDTCEATGCADGYQCVDGACVAPPATSEPAPPPGCTPAPAPKAKRKKKRKTHRKSKAAA